MTNDTYPGTCNTAPNGEMNRIIKDTAWGAAGNPKIYVRYLDWYWYTCTYIHVPGTANTQYMYPRRVHIHECTHTCVHDMYGILHDIHNVAHVQVPHDIHVCIFKHDIILVT